MYNIWQLEFAKFRKSRPKKKIVYGSPIIQESENICEGCALDKDDVRLSKGLRRLGDIKIARTCSEN